MAFFMVLLYVANTLWRMICTCLGCHRRKPRRNVRRSEDEAHELQGQGFHLSGQDRTRQGYHFRANMKSEPRRQLTEVERALLAMALASPRHFPRQAAPARAPRYAPAYAPAPATDPAPATAPAPAPATSPATAPTPAPAEATKGSSESVRVTEISSAADGHQSDQNTDAATREPDATQQHKNEPQNIQPITRMRSRTR
ncbi:hypothetical protein GX51_02779 [Blastomyces parvus]|uniref:Uncharacterized protein n=1 Tax=Blastomyces parvus TaxID=2060905 RepID=A0A2B7X9M8_9EURO|nr:hypothetical protein GX51_02779 [Blastomyces parvus]